MFAFKPRKEMEIAIRILLIAVILFNAFVPTAAIAKASQQSISPANPSPKIAEQENQNIPTFERPLPRFGESVEEQLRADKKNPITSQQASTADLKTSTVFIENVGQFDPHTRFQAETDGATIFFSDDAIWYTLLKPLAKDPNIDHRKTPIDERREENQKPRKGVNLKVNLIDSNPHPSIESFNKVTTNFSYFTGRDQTNWFTDVPAWEGIRYVDIYPGMDLEITSEQGRLIWQFSITDSSRFYSQTNQAARQGIRIKISGHRKLQVQNQALDITTDVGTFTLPAIRLNGAELFPQIDNNGAIILPIPSQTSISPEFFKSVSYAISDKTSQGKFASLEARPLAQTTGNNVPPLTPEELLRFSTFFGGSVQDIGQKLVVDQNQMVYVAGYSYSLDFPVTPGAYDSDNLNHDAFVAKIDLVNSQIVYATHIGGYAKPNDLAVDGSGNVYLTGSTRDPNFPTTPGVLDTTRAYGDAGFVSKLSASGNQLLYSTFLGGLRSCCNDENTFGYAIAVDDNGFAYIAGNTLDDTSFAQTTVGYDQTHNGEWDGFVTKINPTATQQVYFTYLGGSGSEFIANKLLLAASGAVYITGETDSSNFPTTPGAYDPSFDGAFVLKLDPIGTTLDFSTFLGGSPADIAMDNTGSLYIALNGANNDFPITSVIDQDTKPWGSLIVKLDPTASTLEFSTHLTDGGDITGISLDSQGYIYVLGNTVDYDVQTFLASYSPLGGYDPACQTTITYTCYDLFIQKLTPAGDKLVYGSYFGGSSVDGSRNVVADDNGNILFLADTSSADFPTTPDAIDNTLGSHNWAEGDVAIVKMSTDISRIPGNTLLSLNPCDCFSEASGSIGGPINTQTGTYDYSYTDLSLPTTAGVLSFQRVYSSQAISMYDLFGPGWTHNHDNRLIFPSDPLGVAGQILFKARGANLYIFYDMGDGTFKPYPGTKASLTQISASPIRYEVKDSTEATYLFDETGKLLTYSDAQGHSWNYTYPSGKLHIDAEGGKYLEIDYDLQGRVASVRDQTGRSVSYHYDANGNLASITDPLDQTWTYEYDPTLNHFLTRVAAPGDVTVERTDYYADGRAWKQYDGEDNLVVELIYNTDGTTTINNVLNDTSPETHVYDERGTLVTQQNAVGSEQEKEYDFNFRPGIITDALENTTRLDWSDNGSNLEHIKDALGSEIFIDYENPNSLNSPTKITDPLGHDTTYTYANTNFPTLPTRIEYPLSFDNGTTFTGTDYKYYDPNNPDGQPAGKLELVTDAKGNKTHYTYTPAGQIDQVITAYQTADAQTTDYNYDDLGRLVQITDNLGALTQVIMRNEYDDAGRLTKTIQNVNPNNPEQNWTSADGKNIYNIVTEYRYDSRSNQIAVIDTYGTITRTYYDLANRPVRIVQNLYVNGTLADIDTSYGSVPQYNPAFPDRNIRTDTIYDDTGNVIVTVDPAGIKTRTYYDSANRPTLLIQNWTGTDLGQDSSLAPVDDSLYPDQNIRTETIYDANSNVIATKDTLGVYTRTYYDALNRPELVVQHWVGNDVVMDPPPSRAAGDCGNVVNVCTENFYDKNGNLIATTDPNGKTTRTYYDSLNRPITVVQNLVGQTISNTTPPSRPIDAFSIAINTNIRTDTWYDQAGNVVAMQDPRGVWTRTYYDSSNRPVAVFQDWTGTDLYGDISTAPAYNPAYPEENISSTVAYNSDGRRDSTTDPLGRVTKYEYNDLGQLKDVIANYVNGGAPQNENNQRNIKTAYEYDALGRQVKVTDTAGRVSLSTYDDLGRLLTGTQNYDSSHAQNYKDTATGNQFNLKTFFTYDARGNQIAVTDTNGIVTRTYYDLLGRSETVVRNFTGTITDPTAPTRGESPTANLRTDTIYLGNGSVDYVLDEMGKQTDYTYDALGRLITTLDPLSKSTSYTYDANGNRVTMTDGEGVVTKFEYDGVDRLQAVIENYSPTLQPSNETNVRTEYTYDAGGNRLTIRDGNSFLEGVDYRTVFTYDALGRLKTETDAEGHQWVYDYDKLGNRVKLRDAKIQDTTYEYDELNRLKLIDYPAPDANVSFEYDALGRRLNMTDGIGTTYWTYTNLDQPKLITDPFLTDVSYDYDALGNRTSLSYESQSYGYHYNDLNQLDTVTGTGLPTSMTYLYDPAGRLKTATRPNGVTTSYNYFDNGWLQNIFHTSGAATLASYEYLNHNDGNRSQVIENVNTPTLQTEYTLTVNVVGSGTVTRDNNGPYHLNDVVTLTAVANPGWTFTGWSECTGTGSCAVTMTGDKTVTATFVQTEYTLTVNVVGSGTVIRDNNGPYHLNDVVTLTAVANPGWTFTGWSECPGTGSCAVTMTGNKTVTATFVQGEYTLTVNVVGSGTVTRSNNGPYHLNDVVTLTAVPDPNWTFASWSDGASGTTNPINITINGNLTVTANFGAVPVDTGWISPTANAAVTSGAGDNNGFQTSPTSAYGDDTAFAVDTNSGTNTNTSCSNSGKDRHVFYGYNLPSIPSGSTIQGIEVRLDMKVDSTTGAPKSCIELSWNGGTTWTAAKTSTAFTTSEATYILGGATDAWGHAWSTSELSNLRVRITNVASNTSRKFSLDWIPVRVSYIPSALPPGFIFADDFETGNFSRWYWADTGGGDLSVTTQAAAVGTYGMKALVNDTAGLVVYDDSPVNQKHYSARFYFNPNSLNIPNGQGFYLFAGSNNTNLVFCVYLKHVGESYLLNLCGKDDSGNWLENDGIYINNAWTEAEIEWQATSVAGANDGYLKLWINDTQVDSLQNLDTDTLFIKEVSLGVDGPPSGTTGTIYFDAFESRTGSHVGLDPNGPSLAPLPTPPDAIFADGFESGILSAWGWAETDGGNLSVSTQSAVVGSQGMQAVIVDPGTLQAETTIINTLDASDPFYFNPDSATTPAGLENLLSGANDMVVYDGISHNEKHYDARFYFDPNSVNLPNGEGFYLFSGSDAHWVVCLYVKRLGAYYQLALCGEDDSLNWIEDRSVYITDAWQAIEIEWQAASAPGANNGYMKLFVNDVLADDIENLDTDTRSIFGVLLGVDGTPAGTTGTVYFDAFDSRRVNHIGLDPNGPALTGPLTDLIFVDDFESGDFSSWDTANTGGGDLSVSSSAVHQGAYGMQALVNDTGSIYVYDSSATQEKLYHARFYFNPNSLAMTSGDTHAIFEGNDAAYSNVFGVLLNSASGSYRLQFRTKNDAGTYTTSGFYPISNTWHAIEIEWQASSTSLTSDGFMKLWIDGNLTATLSGIDNDTRMIDNVSLGAVNSLDAGTSGTMLFDDFESRHSSYIGPLAYTAPKLANVFQPDNSLFQPVSYRFAPLQQSSPITITYVYDKLKRLMEANYSNGDYYHYTYDAVGNRKTQTTFIGGLTSVINYNYDHANRITDVDGITYDYDANGNLTYDGVTNYTYDSANRLKTFTNATTTVTYKYNGLNDRLQETVNGVTTTFTMDLNAGLTQALSDGANTYIYGLGRIAQIAGANTEHFLGDALGSVRQMTNATGAITYARAYDPYGVVTSTTGTSSTTYGYTGEVYGDSTQLLYLRARQYAPSMGRFTAKDPSGLEANPYWYATANPINKIDPMGLFSRQQIANSFGFSTFDSVISYYSRNGSGEHWGFLAALLRALPGDDLRSEIPLIGPLIGKPVKWSTSLAHVNRRLGYSDDAGITVDGTPLRTLVQTRNLLNPTHGPGLSPIWRSDEARYFTIRDRTSRYEEYVDGSFSPDLPDFWAISVAASSNSGAAVQGLYITDRFGQAYESIGTYYAGGLTNLELAYGEGYIEEPTTAGLRSLSLQNPGELSAKISGGNVCFSLGGAIIAGVSTGVCMNRTFISVYSVGAQIGFSGIYNPSFTWKTSFDKTRGWNWAIEDRLNGIFPSDLITMPEVPFTGCENYLPLDIR